MEKVIDMKDVSWRRTGKDILHHIDWTVNKGEHWAVLGLNGAGKTSLLNMVNGYIWPTTGEVTVLGERFGKTDIHELRRSIGWVSSSLRERVNEYHLTEEIVISGKYAAVGVTFVEPTEEDYTTARKWMELLQVEHTYGKRYGICSNGEKQKILLARSLMANPQLLILDEATNGLDFVAREELLQTIERLVAKKEAPTIIFVTHHIEEVLPIFTHVLLLKDGTIFERGTRQEVLTNRALSKMYNEEIEVHWRSDRVWLTLVDKNA